MKLGTGIAIAGIAIALGVSEPDTVKEIIGFVVILVFFLAM